MRWVRGKLRGPCAFLVHRSGQEQIDGPASIADDFNHNDGPQASASTTEITNAVRDLHASPSTQSSRANRVGSPAIAS